MIHHKVFIQDFLDKETNEYLKQLIKRVVLIFNIPVFKITRYRGTHYINKESIGLRLKNNIGFK